jgi:CheY-like chemotaxis protein
MKRRRVLIVESDVIVRLAIEASLTDLGPVAFISRRSALAAQDSLNERIDFAFISASGADAGTFAFARALMARDVPFAFITSESGDELPRVWRAHTRVTKSPRRASVQMALQQAAEDLLVA